MHLHKPLALLVGLLSLADGQRIPRGLQQYSPNADDAQPTQGCQEHTITESYIRTITITAPGRTRTIYNTDHPTLQLNFVTKTTTDTAWDTWTKTNTISDTKIVRQPFLVTDTTTATSTRTIIYDDNAPTFTKSHWQTTTYTATATVPGGRSPTHYAPKALTWKDNPPVCNGGLMPGWCYAIHYCIERPQLTSMCYDANEILRQYRENGRPYFWPILD